MEVVGQVRYKPEGYYFYFEFRRSDELSIFKIENPFIRSLKEWTDLLNAIKNDKKHVLELKQTDHSVIIESLGHESRNVVSFKKKHVCGLSEIIEYQIHNNDISNCIDTMLNDPLISKLWTSYTNLSKMGVDELKDLSRRIKIELKQRSKDTSELLSINRKSSRTLIIIRNDGKALKIEDIKDEFLRFGKCLATYSGVSYSIHVSFDDIRDSEDALSQKEHVIKRLSKNM